SRLRRTLPRSWGVPREATSPGHRVRLRSKLLRATRGSMRGVMKHDAPHREEAEVELGSVLEFMRVLWAVDHGLEAASKRMEARLGVTGPQRLVLRILGRYPSASAGRLAEILHLHPSTLTGILKRLETRGLITRRVDPADGRRALFDLTARGLKVDGL